MNKWTWLIALFIAPLAGNSWGQDARSEELSRVFHSANQEYENGKYAEAVSQYEKLLQLGLESGEVYFNLGNSYFRSGNLGLAVFHYRKAHSLLPRDPDVRFNLNYARQKATDKIESAPSAWDQVFFLRVPLSEKETYYGWALASTLLFLSLMLSLFKKNDLTRWARLISIAVFLFSLSILVTRSVSEQRFGVVTSPEARVYSGFGRDNVVLFSLHEGAEFTALKESDNHWVQLVLPDKKRGWVSMNDVRVEP